MRWLVTLVTMAVVAGALAATVPPAHAQSCQQLWVERNSYYKARGYCFKTARAIAYFGNGGCYIQNEGQVPLSAGERARIDQIRRLEQAYRCPL
jgi:YARHG domain